METGELVSQSRKIALVSCMTLMLGGIGSYTTSFLIKPSYADNHGKVRIYEVNKKGQMNKRRWMGKPENQVCHNSSKPRLAHRFSQIGYDFCLFFSEENCSEESVVTAMWNGKRYKSKDIDVKQPQEKIYQGSQWYFHPSENIEIKSWVCTEGQLNAELN